MSSVNSSLFSCSSSPPCLIAETDGKEEEDEKDDEVFRLFSAFKENLERSPSQQKDQQPSHMAMIPCVSAYVLWIFLRCMYTPRRRDVDHHGETHGRDRSLTHPSDGGEEDFSSLLSLDSDNPMQYNTTPPSSLALASSSSSVSLSSRRHLRYFLDLAAAFAYSNGLLMFDRHPLSSSSPSLFIKKRKKIVSEESEEGERRKLRRDVIRYEDVSLPLPYMPQAAPFTLFPSPFPRHLFCRAKRLAVPFNRLVDRLTCQPKLLLFLLRDVLEVDPFTRRLADICRRVYIQPMEPSSERRRIVRTQHELKERKDDRHGLSLSSKRTGELQGGGEEKDETSMFFFSSSFRRPPRNIQEDLRIHITRSDYMLDVSLTPKESIRPEQEKEGEKQEKEQIVRFDLKQVEINTIAASFAGLSGKVTKLHRILLRSLLTLGSRHSDGRTSLSSFSDTLYSLQGLHETAIKKEETVIDEIAPVNKPIKLLAEGLALGHAMYRRRYANDGLTDREERKKKNNGREEAEEEERKEKEREEEKERRKRRRGGACDSSRDFVVLFVCMEEERNEVDQRLLQIELTKSYGLHVYRATIPTLLSMWKTGELAILRDDADETLVRHDVLYDPDRAIPPGRLVLCRPAKTPGNSSFSSSTHTSSSLCREEEEEKRNTKGMYCNSSYQEIEKEEKCTKVSISSGTSSDSCGIEIYSEISIIYYRTCYSPDQYVNEEVWRLREVFESSHAIKIPSVPAQLAGTKKIQEVFSDEGLPLHLVPVEYLSPIREGRYKEEEEKENGEQKDEEKNKMTLLRGGHELSEQREQKKKNKKERSAKGGEEEREEEDSGKGRSGVLRVEEEDMESREEEKKKKFVWLLDYLLHGRENDRRKRTEEEQEIRREVQSVFQLQVDPSEAIHSSSSPSPSSSSPPCTSIEDEEDEEKQYEKRRRRRAREAVEGALRTSSSSLRECEERRDISSSSSPYFSSSSWLSCLSHEGSYILKPQREGGGNNIYGEEAENLLKTGSPEILKQFVLMKKMNSPHVPVLFVRADPSERTDGEEEGEEGERFLSNEEKKGEKEEEQAKQEKKKKDQGDLTRGRVEEESHSSTRRRRRCLRCTYSPGIQELGVFGVMVVEGVMAKEGEKERKKKSKESDGNEEMKREGASELSEEMKQEISSKEKEKKKEKIKKGDEKEIEDLRDRGLDEGWDDEDDSLIGSDNGSIEMMNRCAGWMVRTKASASHEGGVAAGFGALDSPLLLDDRLFETFLRVASHRR
ncbi:eukaryotic glutathione atp binding domain-containing protein [Cystoisospora suis]|uniref:Eukaryotic glutathione atp binding domain-containing protein n=1 Tax=Cystoisospora suis TaxID=483139 RepID=A0A2C6KLV7_9APIC|nr:eukaryotic glutathione atp binding domain-containing protein [Cystoisospora suis]